MDLFLMENQIAAFVQRGVLFCFLQTQDQAAVFLLQGKAERQGRFCDCNVMVGPTVQLQGKRKLIDSRQQPAEKVLAQLDLLPFQQARLCTVVPLRIYLVDLHKKIDNWPAFRCKALPAEIKGKLFPIVERFLSGDGVDEAVDAPDDIFSSFAYLQGDIEMRSAVTAGVLDAREKRNLYFRPGDPGCFTNIVVQQLHDLFISVSSRISRGSVIGEG